MSHQDARQLLGAFLRAHRERMPAPKERGRRRRTPGLRREELAEMCGVGLTWITWLEQGRDISASPATLARLAEALQLSSAERASLFDLAGKHDPALPEPLETNLPAALLALPDFLTIPAYLLDHGWNARAWNAAAAQLFRGWLDAPLPEVNLLRFVFLVAEAKSLIADWEERATRLVAEFRADYSRRPRDPVLQDLLDALLTESPFFAGLWQAQAVRYREGGNRRFHHPTEGVLDFMQTTLLIAAYPECKLVCLAPMKGE